jgi:RNA polymerase sigma-70 factor (ECF subfamily)
MADLARCLYLRILIVRCQVGERAALEELIAQVNPRLRGFLHKLLSRPERVDDVAQDVWLDVFRGLPKLENVDAFFPWFYRIAATAFTGCCDAATSVSSPLRTWIWP